MGVVNWEQAQTAFADELKEFGEKCASEGYRHGANDGYALGLKEGKNAEKVPVRLTIRMHLQRNDIPGYLKMVEEDWGLEDVLDMRYPPKLEELEENE